MRTPKAYDTPMMCTKLQPLGTNARNANASSSKGLEDRRPISLRRKMKEIGRGVKHMNDGMILLLMDRTAKATW